MNEWRIFRGTGEPHDGIRDLPPPPRWREFTGDSPAPRSIGEWEPQHIERARRYQAGEEILDLVNTALYLRRPLLVTGRPGVGKSDPGPRDRLRTGTTATHLSPSPVD
jgi:hypothetical protein